MMPSEIVLTQNLIVAHNLPTGNALPVGFSDRISIGVQSPLKTVVFLCQKFSTVIKSFELYIYGVVIWGVERLTAPMRGTENPFNYAAQIFSVFGGGYSILSIGSPL